MKMGSFEVVKRRGASVILTPGGIYSRYSQAAGFTRAIENKWEILPGVRMTPASYSYLL